MKDFRADVARYYAVGARRRDVLLNPAVWAILWYRLGRSIYSRTQPAWFLFPLKFVHVLGSVYFDAFLQMRLNVRAQIGPGLMIAHTGGITLHPEVIIGANCDLAHQVTIGAPGAGRQGVPRIGDSVYIGTGAVLIGQIFVGDGARIGANSLVNRDVPEGATVIGVPAQVFHSNRQTTVAEVPRYSSVSDLTTKSSREAPGNDGHWERNIS